MKKLKLVLTAIALFAITTTSFANEINSNTTNGDFRNEIASLIGAEAPTYLTNGKDIKAKISLMLNNNNEVIVVSVDSKSNSVASYVKAKLNYQKIDVKGLKKGKIYTVPLTIKQS